MTTQGVADVWVASELRALKKSKIPFVLNALRRPEDTYFTADDIVQLNAETQVIYPPSKAAVLIAFALAPFRFPRGFFPALWNALAGPRETFRTRLVVFWHLMLACHWVSRPRPCTPTHIHSQWIHSAGSVAMYSAWLLGVTFSFTGHAADLFRNRQALHDKIKRAKFIICISEFHRQFYLDNGASPDQLHIVYCGINLSHFTPATRVRAADAPFHIISTGRLVEKKGFDTLIRACGVLRDRGVDFTCTIGGNGPLEESLRAQLRAADLTDHVTLTGQAISQEDLPTFMAAGDLFVLYCVWAKDNDVDGLPQMLMEAMACGLPAISTRLVGIPDLVVHKETGLLVDADGDADALADIIVRLMQDPALSTRLTQQAQIHLQDKFNLDTCVMPLLQQYNKLVV
ncbi:glycosyltransferase family 4 protein [Pseudophaeobacter sp.]